MKYVIVDVCGIHDVTAYQHEAARIGDGLLVYFGYPLAHDDDAQRAVRAGLGLVEAIGGLNTYPRAAGAHLRLVHRGL